MGLPGLEAVGAAIVLQDALEEHGCLHGRGMDASAMLEISLGSHLCGLEPMKGFFAIPPLHEAMKSTWTL